MRVLLDSHVFLWWITDDARLSARARRAIAAPSTECLLSHASVWQLGVGISLGKLAIDQPLAKFVLEQCAVNGFHLLPVAFEHVCGVERLPWHHRDPFDRLLVSQALIEGLAVATHDAALKRYGIKVV